MADYVENFDLTATPFGDRQDLRFAYASKLLEVAADKMHYAVEQRQGLFVLTGEDGTGKTVLAQEMMRRWRADPSVVAAYVTDPAASLPAGFLRLILDAFGLPRRHLAEESRAALRDFLLGHRLAGRTCVLLIDDAERIKPHSRVALHRLVDEEYDGRRCFRSFCWPARSCSGNSATGPTCAATSAGARLWIRSPLRTPSACSGTGSKWPAATSTLWSQRPCIAHCTTPRAATRAASAACATTSFPMPARVGSRRPTKRPWPPRWCRTASVGVFFRLPQAGPSPTPRFSDGSGRLRGGLRLQEGEADDADEGDDEAAPLAAAERPPVGVVGPVKVRPEAPDAVHGQEQIRQAAHARLRPAGAVCQDQQAEQQEVGRQLVELGGVARLHVRLRKDDAPVAVCRLPRQLAVDEVGDTPQRQSERRREGGDVRQRQKAHVVAPPAQKMAIRTPIRPPKNVMPPSVNLNGNSGSVASRSRCCKTNASRPPTTMPTAMA